MSEIESAGDGTRGRNAQEWAQPFAAVRGQRPAGEGVLPGARAGAVDLFLRAPTTAAKGTRGAGRSSSRFAPQLCEWASGRVRCALPCRAGPGPNIS
jgi:hypothetical protein